MIRASFGVAAARVARFRAAGKMADDGNPFRPTAPAHLSSSTVEFMPRATFE
jgi:hypothetical protein